MVLSAPRRRLDQVDAMRPVKQAGVVSTHSIMYFATPGAGSSAVLLLLHVSREGFFFISACMLAYAYANLNVAGLRRFYWRRFLSVGIPYLCWTLIYFLYRMPKSHYPSVSAALKSLGWMAATGYYQLYFLLVIMQFYLVFPLMVRYAQLDALSYLLYLVGGCVVAFHLDQTHAWVCRHARLILVLTAAAALIAEGVFFLAQYGVTSVLGSGDDAFQPSVIPFNVGAIACGYLAGVALVRPWRSARTKAAVRSGSDNAYGIYLSHMLVILALAWMGWGRLGSVISWPLLCLLTVGIVVACCVPLTALLARTPLAVPLTGRKQVPWRGRRNQAKALSPVIARPTTSVLISRVPLPGVAPPGVPRGGRSRDHGLLPVNNAVNNPRS